MLNLRGLVSLHGCIWLLHGQFLVDKVAPPYPSVLELRRELADERGPRILIALEEGAVGHDIHPLAAAREHHVRPPQIREEPELGRADDGHDDHVVLVPLQR
jgi:hypothetical protein